MPFRRQILAAVAAASLPAATKAQPSWPTRPVRIVVPFPPGGTSDVLIRLMQPRLSDDLGQSVVIENRTGGATIIGTDLVAKAPADGYSLLCIANSFTINATLVRNPPFDARRDFTGLASIGFNPHVLVVTNAFPARTVSDVIALAKAAPGRFSYASFGNGTSSHLGGESLKQAAGIQLQHVPYRGGAPAIQDVMTGQVTMMFNNLPDALPLIREGRVRAIALSAAHRAAVLPELPTFEEVGLPSVVSNSWFGLVARADTLTSILTRLNAAVNTVLSAEDLRSRFTEMGVEPRPMSRQAFDDFLHTEFENNAAIIRNSALTLD
jgi:tripartite-type tricarboxylate transporter receptor subunit TctC